MLREIPDPQAPGLRDRSRHRNQTVRDQFRKRRLAVPVRPQKRDPIIWIDAKIQLVEHRAPVVAGTYAFEREQGRGELLRIAQPERRHALGRHASDRLQLCDRLHAALRLARLRGLVAKAVHKRLHVLAMCVLLCARRVLHRQPLGPRAFERVVGAGVERELLVLQMQDRIDRGVQEIAVVADQNHRPRKALEKLLEPERPFEIEIVRGLVEQQQVGLREQHGRQRHPHPPPARELRTRTKLLNRIEAEARENLGRPRRRPVRADVGKPRLDLSNPDRVMRGFGLRDQRRALDVGFEHGVEQRGRSARRFLRDAADAPRARDHDLAVVGLCLAVQDAEQRRLAGPVAPDKAHLVAGRNRGRRPFEQGPAFDPVGEVRDAQHGARSLPAFPGRVKRWQARQRSAVPSLAGGGGLPYQGAPF